MPDQVNPARITAALHQSVGWTMARRIATSGTAGCMDWFNLIKNRSSCDPVPHPPLRCPASATDWNIPTVRPTGLMHVAPADAADVVPGVGLMAQEALLDPCVSLPCDGAIHHLEMHHVMAGRRLVALHAIL